MEANRLEVIEKFALDRMNKYLPKHENWQFRYTRGTRTLGICSTRYNRRTGAVTREIGISKAHALNSNFEDVIDTVLHEIAHAMVGHQHGHNEVWKKACRKIGARPNQYANDSEFNIEFKYYLVHKGLKRIVDRSNRRVKWVKNPEHYWIRKMPHTQGELEVVDYSVAKEFI